MVLAEWEIRLEDAMTLSHCLRTLAEEGWRDARIFV